MLFDFDGTLIDTWRLYLESFRRSLEPHFKRLLTDPEILEYQRIAERRLLQQIVEQAHVNDYFDLSSPTIGLCMRRIAMDCTPEQSDY